jgi:hypothetical protein
MPTQIARFLRSAVLIALGLAVPTTGLHAEGETPKPQPSEAAIERGITEYELTEEGGVQVVIFRGQDGSDLGSLTVARETDGATRYDLSPAGAERLSVVFDGSHGFLTLTDAGTGASGTATFDMQKNEWSRDEAFETLMAKRGGDAELAGIVAADLSAASYEASPTQQPTNSCSSEAPAAPDQEISCSGIWCRGFGIGVSTSICCQESWQDASNCCSNLACWGCCSFLDCDFHCGLTRYFCFCGTSGRSCSYRVY